MTLPVEDASGETGFDALLACRRELERTRTLLLASSATARAHWMRVEELELAIDKIIAANHRLTEELADTRRLLRVAQSDSDSA